MARGVKWGCSYKKTTLIVCSVNIVIALYVLRSLYGSLYLYSNDDLANAVKYTPDEISKMEESIRIRRASEPTKLKKLVKKLKFEFGERDIVELPAGVKHNLTNEILQRLRSLSGDASINEQREAVEKWRNEKLLEVKQSINLNRGGNSTFVQEEAGLLVKALESDWAVLSENIGLWIPAEVTNPEQDDRPEGQEEQEEETLPGPPVPQECHAELHTDYDGVAVRWGLTHRKESAADCCQACLDHAKRAKPGELQCNIWVYCPAENGCYSPDIYEHKNMECWLKYAEKPKLNFKDRYSEAYRNSHPNAPVVVPWAAGVVR
ncbi:unnamed protein product [Linum tenue]|uniref:Apple domain-containing protein n=1 Tax=Linum tenue TaxID=586396 RepID=A0AAV0RNS1_9ROSI|nr:unnamed protein product [Linum tenue]CAI0558359.1 unnamed protein product [Linum tenue]